MRGNDDVRTPAANHSRKKQKSAGEPQDDRHWRVGRRTPERRSNEKDKKTGSSWQKNDRQVKNRIGHLIEPRESPPR
jgi:hypothetical protein